MQNQEEILYTDKILDFIKEKRNIDFSQYRKNLLMRRIKTRVNLTKTKDFTGYFEFLINHPSELDYLMDTMTINFTEFFRDSEVFDIIEKEVIPDIINEKEKTGSKEINVWSCASASGEEAY
jgi:chemotaxis methyl-accepting protein methylase